MIPRLTAGGPSFKGAALYYLHDKREADETERLTSGRVAWTYTLNLPTQDPDRAWRMMAHTAMAQAELKAAAGVKATGRKLIKPVMAFSLAWSPDETPPAPHEMLDAAKEAIAALGLDEHQALVVCHNDTAHPHVHIIVNRVHPATGVAAKGSKSKLQLSTWAEAYEQRRGAVLCVDRVANNAKRRAQQKPDRKPKVSRPEWRAAANEDTPGIAAAHREMFAELAAAERMAAQRRQDEAILFHADRRTERNAIRQRYQASLDAARRPELTVDQARMAAALLRDDPVAGLDGLTRDRSTFTRQDLARHVGRHTVSVEQFRAVLTRLETSPELVRLGYDDTGHERFTTREVQAVEQRMQDHARAVHTKAGREVRPLWPKGMALSKDQDAALRHVIDKPGLAAIVGYAGTGKSTLLAAARRSWEASGHAVQGMTLSGIAADSLKNGSDIESRTIQSRLLQWEKGLKQPGAKDVLVVDEAGMIGSRQMERILHFAAKGGAKVVLVGDPEQLQAIEAGGPFRTLTKQFGAAKLEAVRRQRTPWQQDATRELATGRTRDALDRYRDAGMEHAHRTGQDARAALVAQWKATRTTEPKASQIILAYNRADVADLNTRARAVLREAGQLGPDVSVRTEQGRKAFATGDRVYFLKNDTGLGVRNGTLGTVQRVKDDTLAVRLDGDAARTVTFGLRMYGHIDHGYAATVHKSQGVTVDRAYLYANRSLDRHAAYVAMTRHRDRLDVHWATDSFASREKLARSMSRAAVKDTSLDYDSGQDAPRPSTGGRRAWQQSVAPGHGPAEPQTPHQAAIRAHERLAQVRTARADRAAQRPSAAAKVDHEATLPLQIEAPRPADRPFIVTTAEMLAHDRETADLVQAMEARHQAQLDQEATTRREMTAAAATSWREALAPAPAIEPQPVPAPAPKWSLDR